MAVLSKNPACSGVVDGCAKQEELDIFEANAEGGWYGT